MACVDYHGFLVAAAAEHLRVYLTEALAVHTLHMHISYLASRQLVHLLTAVLNPPFVEQIALRSVADSLHLLLETLACGRVVYSEQHFLSGFSGKQRIVVLTGFYLLVVYLLYYAASLYLRVCPGERSSRYHLHYLQAVSLILVVVESTETCRLLRGSRATVACPCV